MKLVVHFFEGTAKTHLPGSGVCDFQTACGSCWDDGDFEEIEGDTIDCVGCRDAARRIFEALGKRIPREVKKL